MDYLTILATRSLILFTPPSSKPLRTVDSTPNTTPESATLALPSLICPTPVTMPIQSIINARTDVIYFLVNHVLSSMASASEDTDSDLGSSPGGIGIGGGSGVRRGSGSGLGGTPKEVVSEAEILVWKEMDKAKMFARELGQWFSHIGNIRISEKELERLAEKWGMMVQPVEEDQVRPSRMRSDTAASRVSQVEVM